MTDCPPHDWQLDYIARDGSDNFSPIALRLWTCRGCRATMREDMDGTTITEWSNSDPEKESK